MDPEERKLFQKLLDKVEKLEERVIKQGEVLQKREDELKRLKETSQPSQLPPPTGDRLADIILRKNIQRQREQRTYEKTPQAKIRRPSPTAEEIRKNIHLGKIMTYVWKHKIPIGNLEEKESGETVIVED